MKLLIIEPLSDGHHLLYVRRVANEWVRRGYEVILVTYPSSRDHPIYRSMATSLGDRLQTVCIPDEARWRRLVNRVPWTLGKAVYYRMIKRYYPHFPTPDVILLPYIDYLDYPAAFLGTSFGSTPWLGLTIHTSFHYGHTQNERPPPEGVASWSFLTATPERGSRAYEKRS